MAEDTGSRYHFKYVRDRTTKRWVGRDCELRVSAKRKLPKPLRDPEHGDLLSVQVVTSMSVESVYYASYEPKLVDGYRLWSIQQALGRDDLKGRVSYLVSVSWPDPGKETQHDAAEVFPLPPLGNTPPDVWSEWTRAASSRDGAFGWLAEVQGDEEEVAPAPEYPFELRCRNVLMDVPGVPEPRGE
jgi:hypothetical protein